MSFLKAQSESKTEDKITISCSQPESEYAELQSLYGLLKDMAEDQGQRAVTLNELMQSAVQDAVDNPNLLAEIERNEESKQRHVSFTGDSMLTARRFEESCESYNVRKGSALLHMLRRKMGELAEFVKS